MTREELELLEMLLSNFVHYDVTEDVMLMDETKLALSIVKKLALSIVKRELAKYDNPSTDV